MDRGARRSWDTIIIGAGQAGLVTGYYLRQMGEDFIILDEAERVGDSWRKRWDALRLLTPNWANGLPGLDFPGASKAYAGKNEMADFLEEYANRYALPVLGQSKVIALVKSGDGYEVTCSRGIFFCKNIVIANGGYAAPRLPAFAKEIGLGVLQVHSSDYRRAAELPEGSVLVVGAGTSGIQIAMDVAAASEFTGSSRKVFVAGEPTFQIPRFVLHRLGRPFVWALHNIMTLKTIPGRRAANNIRARNGGSPLIHAGIDDALRAGVLHVPRVEGVTNGYPRLVDGTIPDIATVIWCTGYRFDFSWIHIDGITDGHGYPYAYRGVSKSHRGLYFTGMTFQYALTSTWISGIGRDARYTANKIHRQ